LEYLGASGCGARDHRGRANLQGGGFEGFAAEGGVNGEIHLKPQMGTDETQISRDFSPKDVLS
jgi:hypothetical protein